MGQDDINININDNSQEGNTAGIDRLLATVIEQQKRTTGDFDANITSGVRNVLNEMLRKQGAQDAGIDVDAISKVIGKSAAEAMAKMYNRINKDPKAAASQDSNVIHKNIKGAVETATNAKFNEMIDILNSKLQSKGLPTISESQRRHMSKEVTGRAGGLVPKDIGVLGKDLVQSVGLLKTIVNDSVKTVKAIRSLRKDGIDLNEIQAIASGVKSVGSNFSKLTHAVKNVLGIAEKLPREIRDAIKDNVQDIRKASSSQLSRVRSNAMDDPVKFAAVIGKHVADAVHKTPALKGTKAEKLVTNINNAKGDFNKVAANIDQLSVLIEKRIKDKSVSVEDIRAIVSTSHEIANVVKGLPNTLSSGIAGQKPSKKWTDAEKRYKSAIDRMQSTLGRLEGTVELIVDKKGLAAQISEGVSSGLGTDKSLDIKLKVDKTELDAVSSKPIKAKKIEIETKAPTGPSSKFPVTAVDRPGSMKFHYPDNGVETYSGKGGFDTTELTNAGKEVIAAFKAFNEAVDAAIIKTDKESKGTAYEGHNLYRNKRVRAFRDTIMKGHEEARPGWSKMQLEDLRNNIDGSPIYEELKGPITKAIQSINLLEGMVPDKDVRRGYATVVKAATELSTELDAAAKKVEVSKIDKAFDVIKKDGEKLSEVLKEKIAEIKKPEPKVSEDTVKRSKDSSTVSDIGDKMKGDVIRPFKAGPVLPSKEGTGVLVSGNEISGIGEAERKAVDTNVKSLSRSLEDLQQYMVTTIQEELKQSNNGWDIVRKSESAPIQDFFTVAKGGNAKADEKQWAFKVANVRKMSNKYNITPSGNVESMLEIAKSKESDRVADQYRDALPTEIARWLNVTPSKTIKGRKDLGVIAQPLLDIKNTKNDDGTGLSLKVTSDLIESRFGADIKQVFKKTAGKDKVDRRFDNEGIVKTIAIPAAKVTDAGNTVFETSGGAMRGLSKFASFSTGYEKMFDAMVKEKAVGIGELNTFKEQVSGLSMMPSTPIQLDNSNKVAKDMMLTYAGSKLGNPEKIQQQYKSAIIMRGAELKKSNAVSSVKEFQDSFDGLLDTTIRSSEEMSKFIDDMNSKGVSPNDLMKSMDSVEFSNVYDITKRVFEGKNKESNLLKNIGKNPAWGSPIRKMDSAVSQIEGLMPLVEPSRAKRGLHQENVINMMTRSSQLHTDKRGQGKFLDTQEQKHLIKDTNLRMLEMIEEKKILSEEADKTPLMSKRINRLPIYNNISTLGLPEQGSPESLKGGNQGSIGENYLNALDADVMKMYASNLRDTMPFGQFQQWGRNVSNTTNAMTSSKSHIDGLVGSKISGVTTEFPTLRTEKEHSLINSGRFGNKGYGFNAVTELRHTSGTFEDQVLISGKLADALISITKTLVQPDYMAEVGSRTQADIALGTSKIEPSVKPLRDIQLAIEDVDKVFQKVMGEDVSYDGRADKALVEKVTKAISVVRGNEVGVQSAKIAEVFMNHYGRKLTTRFGSKGVSVAPNGVNTNDQDLKSILSNYGDKGVRILAPEERKGAALGTAMLPKSMGDLASELILKKDSSKESQSLANELKKSGNKFMVDIFKDKSIVADHEAITNTVTYSKFSSKMKDLYGKGFEKVEGVDQVKSDIANINELKALYKSSMGDEASLFEEKAIDVRISAHGAAKRGLQTEALESIMNNVADTGNEGSTVIKEEFDKTSYERMLGKSTGIGKFNRGSLSMYSESLGYSSSFDQARHGDKEGWRDAIKKNFKSADEALADKAADLEMQSSFYVDVLDELGKKRKSLVGNKFVQVIEEHMSTSAWKKSDIDKGAKGVKLNLPAYSAYASIFGEDSSFMKEISSNRLSDSARNTEYIKALNMNMYGGNTEYQELMKKPLREKHSYSIKDMKEFEASTGVFGDPDSPKSMDDTIMDTNRFSTPFIVNIPKTTGDDRTATEELYVPSPIARQVYPEPLIPGEYALDTVSRRIQKVINSSLAVQRGIDDPDDLVNPFEARKTIKFGIADMTKAANKAKNAGDLDSVKGIFEKLRGVLRDDVDVNYAYHTKAVPVVKGDSEVKHVDKLLDRWLTDPKADEMKAYTQAIGRASDILIGPSKQDTSKMDKRFVKQYEAKQRAIPSINRAESVDDLKKYESTLGIDLKREDTMQYRLAELERAKVDYYDELTKKILGKEGAVGSTMFSRIIPGIKGKGITASVDKSKDLDNFAVELHKMSSIEGLNSLGDISKEVFSIAREHKENVSKYKKLGVPMLEEDEIGIPSSSAKKIPVTYTKPFNITKTEHPLGGIDKRVTRSDFPEEKEGSLYDLLKYKKDLSESWSSDAKVMGEVYDFIEESLNSHVEMVRFPFTGTSSITPYKSKLIDKRADGRDLTEGTVVIPGNPQMDFAAFDRVLDKLSEVLSDLGDKRDQAREENTVESNAQADEYVKQIDSIKRIMSDAMPKYLAQASKFDFDGDEGYVNTGRSEAARAEVRKHFEVSETRDDSIYKRWRDVLTSDAMQEGTGEFPLASMAKSYNKKFAHDKGFNYLRTPFLSRDLEYLDQNEKLDILGSTGGQNSKYAAMTDVVATTLRNEDDKQKVIDALSKVEDREDSGKLFEAVLSSGASAGTSEAIKGGIDKELYEAKYADAIEAQLFKIHTGPDVEALYRLQRMTEMETGYKGGLISDTNSYDATDRFKSLWPKESIALANRPETEYDDMMQEFIRFTMQKGMDVKHAGEKPLAGEILSHLSKGNTPQGMQALWERIEKGDSYGGLKEFSDEITSLIKDRLGRYDTAAVRNEANLLYKARGLDTSKLEGMDRKALESEIVDLAGFKGFMFDIADQIKEKAIEGLKNSKWEPNLTGDKRDKKVREKIEKEIYGEGINIKEHITNQLQPNYKYRTLTAYNNQSSHYKARTGSKLMTVEGDLNLQAMKEKQSVRMKAYEEKYANVMSTTDNMSALFTKDSNKGGYASMVNTSIDNLVKDTERVMAIADELNSKWQIQDRDSSTYYSDLVDRVTNEIAPTNLESEVLSSGNVPKKLNTYSELAGIPALSKEEKYTIKSKTFGQVYNVASESTLDDYKQKGLVKDGEVMDDFISNYHDEVDKLVDKLMRSVYDYAQFDKASEAMTVRAAQAPALTALTSGITPELVKSTEVFRKDETPQSELNEILSRTRKRHVVPTVHRSADTDTVSAMVPKKEDHPDDSLDHFDKAYEDFKRISEGKSYKEAVAAYKAMKEEEEKKLTPEKLDFDPDISDSDRDTPAGVLAEQYKDMLPPPPSEPPTGEAAGGFDRRAGGAVDVYIVGVAPGVTFDISSVTGVIRPSVPTGTVHRPADTDTVSGIASGVGGGPIDYGIKRPPEKPLTPLSPSDLDEFIMPPMVDDGGDLMALFNNLRSLHDDAKVYQATKSKNPIALDPDVLSKLPKPVSSELVKTLKRGPKPKEFIETIDRLNESKSIHGSDINRAWRLYRVAAGDFFIRQAEDAIKALEKSAESGNFSERSEAYARFSRSVGQMKSIVERGLGKQSDIYTEGKTFINPELAKGAGVYRTREQLIEMSKAPLGEDERLRRIHMMAVKDLEGGRDLMSPRKKAMKAMDMLSSVDEEKVALLNNPEMLSRKGDQVIDAWDFKAVSRDISKLIRAMEMYLSNNLMDDEEASEKNNAKLYIKYLKTLEKAYTPVDVSGKENGANVLPVPDWIQVKDQKALHMRNRRNIDKYLKRPHKNEKGEVTGPEIGTKYPYVEKIKDPITKAIIGNKSYLYKKYGEYTDNTGKVRGAVSGGKPRDILDEQQGSGRSFNAALGRVVRWGAASTMVYGGASQLKSMLSTISDIEDEMANLKMVMNPETTNFDSLQTSAINLAKQYGTPTTEVLKGMRVFAQQGLDQSEVEERTKTATLASNVTTLDAAEATEALTAAMKVYGREGESTARYLDSWSEVESRHAVTAGDMANAIKKAAAAASTAGVSFDQLNGIVASIGSVTRQSGKEVGTSLRFIFRRLTSEKAPKELAKHNISVVDGAGEMKSGFDILSDLAGKWDELTDSQKMNIATSIGGTRQYNSLLVMMNNWDEALSGINHSMNSKGSAERRNIELMKTYSKQVAQLKQSAVELQAEFGKVYLPIAKTGVKGLRTLLEVISGIPGSVKLAIVGIASFFTYLVKGESIISGIAERIRSLKAGSKGILGKGVLEFKKSTYESLGIGDSSDPDLKDLKVVRGDGQKSADFHSAGGQASFYLTKNAKTLFRNVAGIFGSLESNTSDVSSKLKGAGKSLSEVAAASEFLFGGKGKNTKSMVDAVKGGKIGDVVDKFKAKDFKKAAGSIIKKEDIGERAIELAMKDGGKVFAKKMMKVFSTVAGIVTEGAGMAMYATGKVGDVGAAGFGKLKDGANYMGRAEAGAMTSVVPLALGAAVAFPAIKASIKAFKKLNSTAEQYESSMKGIKSEQEGQLQSIRRMINTYSKLEDKVEKIKKSLDPKIKLRQQNEGTYKAPIAEMIKVQKSAKAMSNEVAKLNMNAIVGFDKAGNAILKSSDAFGTYHNKLKSLDRLKVKNIIATDMETLNKYMDQLTKTDGAEKWKSWAKEFAEEIPVVGDMLAGGINVSPAKMIETATNELNNLLMERSKNPISTSFDIDIKEAMDKLAEIRKEFNSTHKSFKQYFSNISTEGLSDHDIIQTMTSDTMKRAFKVQLDDPKFDMIKEKISADDLMGSEILRRVSGSAQQFIGENATFTADNLEGAGIRARERDELGNINAKSGDIVTFLDDPENKYNIPGNQAQLRSKDGQAYLRYYDSEKKEMSDTIMTEDMMGMVKDIFPIVAMRKATDEAFSPMSEFIAGASAGLRGLNAKDFKRDFSLGDRFFSDIATSSIIQSTKGFDPVEEVYGQSKYQEGWDDDIKKYYLDYKQRYADTVAPLDKRTLSGLDAEESSIANKVKEEIEKLQEVLKNNQVVFQMREAFAELTKTMSASKRALEESIATEKARQRAQKVSSGYLKGTTQGIDSAIDTGAQRYKDLSSKQRAVMNSPDYRELAKEYLINDIKIKNAEERVNSIEKTKVAINSMYETADGFGSIKSETDRKNYTEAVKDTGGDIGAAAIVVATNKNTDAISKVVDNTGAMVNSLDDFLQNQGDSSAADRNIERALSSKNTLSAMDKLVGYREDFIEKGDAAGVIKVNNALDTLSVNLAKEHGIENAFDRVKEGSLLDGLFGSNFSGDEFLQRAFSGMDSEVFVDRFDANATKLGGHKTGAWLNDINGERRKGILNNKKYSAYIEEKEDDGKKPLIKPKTLVQLAAVAGVISTMNKSESNKTLEKLNEDRLKLENKKRTITENGGDTADINEKILINQAAIEKEQERSDYYKTMQRMSLLSGGVIGSAKAMGLSEENITKLGGGSLITGALGEIAWSTMKGEAPSEKATDYVKALKDAFQTTVVEDKEMGWQQGTAFEDARDAFKSEYDSKIKAHTGMTTEEAEKYIKPGVLEEQLKEFESKSEEHKEYSALKQEAFSLKTMELHNPEVDFTELNDKYKAKFAEFESKVSKEDMAKMDGDFPTALKDTDRLFKIEQLSKKTIDEIRKGIDKDPTQPFTGDLSKLAIALLTATTTAYAAGKNDDKNRLATLGNRAAKDGALFKDVIKSDMEVSQLVFDEFYKNIEAENALPASKKDTKEAMMLSVENDRDGLTGNMNEALDKENKRLAGFRKRKDEIVSKAIKFEIAEEFEKEVEELNKVIRKIDIVSKVSAEFDAVGDLLAGKFRPATMDLGKKRVSDLSPEEYMSYKDTNVDLTKRTKHFFGLFTRERVSTVKAADAMRRLQNLQEEQRSRKESLANDQLQLSELEDRKESGIEPAPGDQMAYDELTKIVKTKKAKLEELKKEEMMLREGLTPAYYSSQVELSNKDSANLLQAELSKAKTARGMKTGQGLLAGTYSPTASDIDVGPRDIMSMSKYEYARFKYGAGEESDFVKYDTEMSKYNSAMDAVNRDRTLLPDADKEHAKKLEASISENESKAHKAAEAINKLTDSFHNMFLTSESDRERLGRSIGAAKRISSFNNSRRYGMTNTVNLGMEGFAGESSLPVNILDRSAQQYLYSSSGSDVKKLMNALKFTQSEMDVNTSTLNDIDAKRADVVSMIAQHEVSGKSSVNLKNRLTDLDSQKANVMSDLNKYSESNKSFSEMVKNMMDVSETLRKFKTSINDVIVAQSMQNNAGAKAYDTATDKMLGGSHPDATVMPTADQERKAIEVGRPDVKAGNPNLTKYDLRYVELQWRLNQGNLSQEEAARVEDQLMDIPRDRKIDLGGREQRKQNENLARNTAPLKSMLSDLYGVKLNNADALLPEQVEQIDRLTGIIGSVLENSTKVTTAGDLTKKLENERAKWEGDPATHNSIINYLKTKDPNDLVYHGVTPGQTEDITKLLAQLKESMGISAKGSLTVESLQMKSVMSPLHAELIKQTTVLGKIAEALSKETDNSSAGGVIEKTVEPLATIPSAGPLRSTSIPSGTVKNDSISTFGSKSPHTFPEIYGEVSSNLGKDGSFDPLGTNVTPEPLKPVDKDELGPTRDLAVEMAARNKGPISTDNASVRQSADTAPSKNRLERLKDDMRKLLSIVPGFAVGGVTQSGKVYGPGGPKEDKVLVKLSPGENVTNVVSSKKMGQDVMDYINKYGEIPMSAAIDRVQGYAGGGAVRRGQYYEDINGNTLKAGDYLWLKRKRQEDAKRDRDAAALAKLAEENGGVMPTFYGPRGRVIDGRSYLVHQRISEKLAAEKQAMKDFIFEGSVIKKNGSMFNDSGSKDAPRRYYKDAWGNSISESEYKIQKEAYEKHLSMYDAAKTDSPYHFTHSNIGTYIGDSKARLMSAINQYSLQKKNRGYARTWGQDKNGNVYELTQEEISTKRSRAQSKYDDKTETTHSSLSTQDIGGYIPATPKVKPSVLIQSYVPKERTTSLADVSAYSVNDVTHGEAKEKRKEEVAKGHQNLKNAIVKGEVNRKPISRTYDLNVGDYLSKVPMSPSRKSWAEQQVKEWKSAWRQDDADRDANRAIYHPNMVGIINDAPSHMTAPDKKPDTIILPPDPSYIPPWDRPKPVRRWFWQKPKPVQQAKAEVYSFPMPPDTEHVVVKEEKAVQKEKMGAFSPITITKEEKAVQKEKIRQYSPTTMNSKGKVPPKVNTYGKGTGTIPFVKQRIDNIHSDIRKKNEIIRGRKIGVTYTDNWGRTDTKSMVENQTSLDWITASLVANSYRGMSNKGDLFENSLRSSRKYMTGPVVSDPIATALKISSMRANAALNVLPKIDKMSEADKLSNAVFANSILSDNKKFADRFKGNPVNWSQAAIQKFIDTAKDRRGISGRNRSLQSLYKNNESDDHIKVIEAFLPGKVYGRKDGGKIPVYHTGKDFVPETGPAILERGERVIPKELNEKGMGMSLNINTAPFDKFIDKLESIELKVEDKEVSVKLPTNGIELKVPELPVLKVEDTVLKVEDKQIAVEGTVKVEDTVLRVEDKVFSVEDKVFSINDTMVKVDVSGVSVPVDVTGVSVPVDASNAFVNVDVSGVSVPVDTSNAFINIKVPKIEVDAGVAAAKISEAVSNISINAPKSVGSDVMDKVSSLIERLTNQVNLSRVDIDNLKNDVEIVNSKVDEDLKSTTALIDQRINVSLGETRRTIYETDSVAKAVQSDISNIKVDISNKISEIMRDIYDMKSHIASRI